MPDPSPDRPPDWQPLPPPTIPWVPPSGAEPPASPSDRPPTTRLRWPRERWLLPVAGLAAAVLAIAFLPDLLRLFGGPPTPPPGSPSAAVATATPDATPRSTPSASPAAVAARIAEVLAQVPPIRGLQPKKEVPLRLIDRATFQQQLAVELAKENPPEVLAATTRLWERLGLLPPGSDLQKLSLELLGASAIGVYFPDRDEMAVIDAAARLRPLDRLTIAHEYTHALQDQHFGLDELPVDDPAEGDRGLAQLAMVEGDATQLMFEWAQEHLTPLELLSIGVGALDPEQQALLERMPPILQRQLAFPYLEGQAFIADVQATGGWRAVDRLWAAPPLSTEQVLHPEKYRAGEKPVDVEVPAAVAALGGGWKEALQDTLGEVNIGVWLAQGQAAGAAPGASEGWAGDRVASYEGPNGSWGISWRTAWDSPADAAEFRTSAATVLTQLRSQTRLIAGGREVTVLLASDAAVLGVLAGLED